MIWLVLLSSNETEIYFDGHYFLSLRTDSTLCKCTRISIVNGFSPNRKSQHNNKITNFYVEMKDSERERERTGEKTKEKI